MAERLAPLNFLLKEELFKKIDFCCIIVGIMDARARSVSCKQFTCWDFYYLLGGLECLDGRHDSC